MQIETEILAALIGCGGTLLAAVIAAVVALLGSRQRKKTEERQLELERRRLELEQQVSHQELDLKRRGQALDERQFVRQGVQTDAQRREAALAGQRQAAQLQRESQLEALRRVTRPLAGLDRELAPLPALAAMLRASRELPLPPAGLEAGSAAAAQSIRELVSSLEAEISRQCPRLLEIAGQSDAASASAGGGLALLAELRRDRPCEAMLERILAVHQEIRRRSQPLFQRLSALESRQP
jgi:hypothetical protein